MGIRRQNVKALFKSKNLETIYKASEVMGVPFEMLIGYIEEPDLDEIPLLPLEGRPFCVCWREIATSLL